VGNSQAWEVLKVEPKWSTTRIDSVSQATICPLLSSRSPHEGGSGDGDACNDQNTSAIENDIGAVTGSSSEDGIVAANYSSQAAGIESTTPSCAARPQGKAGAKARRVTDLQSQAVMSIADSLRQSVSVKRERVAMLAFEISDMDEEDLELKREFFKLKRKKAVALARDEALIVDRSNAPDDGM
jgi:hypothetical protein